MKMDSFGFFFVGAVFIIVLGFIIFAIISSLKQWNKNNNSPKLSVPAQIVTKRSHTSGGSGDSSASTFYYITFQFDSGDRLELPISGHEYGMLAEDDIGVLTFQGTRYHSFERK